MAPLFEKGLPKGRDTRVRESDKRRFRERIATEFPSVTAAQLDALVPPGKADELKVVKFGPREDLYRSGPKGQPIFFTSDECEGKLVPTCYSLHVAPQLLRTVQVYSGVDKKIRGGAHVFVPGVVRPANLSDVALELGDQWPAAVFSGRWEKGDLCAVVGEGKWAACAVGRFAVSYSDVLASGMERGTAVEVLHHLDDALWSSGNTSEPTSAQPPPEAAAAVSAYRQRLAAVAAAEEQAAREKAAVNAAKARAYRREEVIKRCKRVEKLLRQVDEVKAKATAGVQLNADQKAKLEKESDLREELSAAEAELSELALALSVTTSDSSADDITSSTTATADTAAIAEALAAAGDSNIETHQQQQQQQQQCSSDERTAAQPSTDSSSEWIVVSMEGDSSQSNRPLDRPLDSSDVSEHVSEHVSAAGSSAQSDAAEHSAATASAAAASDTTTDTDVAAAASAAEDEQNDSDSTAANDELFTRGVLTALSSAPLPALANVAFARATKLTGGVSIKHTRWKKAGKFLADFSAAISAHEPKPGVVEITKLDLTAVPPFEPLQEGEFEDGDAPNSGESTAAPAKKKKGGLVTVVTRKVCGKNVTIVDNLDSWGYTKESMGELAKELRRRYSASCSVGPRQGSDGATSRKALWSVQLQGKYSEQVRAFLMERGVSTVKIMDK